MTTVKAYATELQQQPLMVNFIKCFAQVHHNHIGLATVIEGISELFNKLGKLSFAAKLATKRILIWEKDIVLIKVSHHIGCYNVLHNLATDAR